MEADVWTKAGIPVGQSPIRTTSAEAGGGGEPKTGLKPWTLFAGLAVLFFLIFGRKKVA